MPAADAPRLTSRVTLQDVSFRSAALGRDISYRVIQPVGASKPLPVVYLLHGGGGGYRDWSNYSDVARYAESGLILVMPEGSSSYYTNAVDPPQDRYEDYIVHDLIADVQSRFAVAGGRSNRAIVGISMGGFGESCRRSNFSTGAIVLRTGWRQRFERYAGGREAAAEKCVR